MNSRKMSSSAVLLGIIQIFLLLYLTHKVRTFTPRSKRFSVPKYSNLEGKTNGDNRDDIGSNMGEIISDSNNNNTISPGENSRKSSSSSLPTNTVMSAMTTPVASLNKKFPRNNGNNERQNDRKMDLMWCQSDRCQDSLRERVVGDHNTIVFNGPATGQVAYRWNKKAYPISKSSESKSHSSSSSKENTPNKTPPFATPVRSKIASVLLLVKRDDDDLLQIAAHKVPELTEVGIDVLMAPELAAKLKHYYGVDDERIHLFEPPKDTNIDDYKVRYVEDDEEEWVRDMNYGNTFPDLICTLGGDGLLLYASSLFQGPVPPLLAISGGSLGFLTAFSEHEMTNAIRVALGMTMPIAEDGEDDGDDDDENITTEVPFSSVEEEEQGALQVFPPNMPSYPYEPLVSEKAPRFTFGLDEHICMTIRMRLDCRIVNREGVVRGRYNVLNEVVIDRGGSPYLAALECFCDDVHLTTVQADGIIFATPSGSTAYSMSAGGSVVHPAVPCILVTPICPHVLSFRSMVFPDHVVLRCFVPDDARSFASVAFDGKHRSELQRGDSVQIQMSAYPFPTINKGDHSSDWLESLKSSFNFNTRPRQKPL
ncbi:unnamed protein product [Pseudo-nitzschia multistriata]|uniref:NAD+ kinase n=1 Tax=Pseudo-nitzschia multistriata TaxID=183589 RepID=A0A448YVZ8_9STRA|nr:unnamed protein product [Pseudo-nitzschia multistriata]